MVYASSCYDLNLFKTFLVESMLGFISDGIGLGCVIAHSCMCEYIDSKEKGSGNCELKCSDNRKQVYHEIMKNIFDQYRFEENAVGRWWFKAVGDRM